jgi:hypothetical protein
VVVKEGPKSESSRLDESVPGLALVATRPIEDEEVLMNYRLSTHVEAPAWYYPVDAAEDKRRWT